MPQPPPHLKHLLVEDDLPENCPWSVSGPQFPIPTAMQQRYCYPKGRSEYSSLKGGALWTMFGANGKEDMQYRLLHVYYSAKRANNRGMPGGAPPIESLQLPLSAPGSPSSQQRRLDDADEFCHSLAPTTSASSSLCHSTLTFDTLTDMSHPESPANGSRPSVSASQESCQEQVIVSPVNDLGRNQQWGRAYQINSLKDDHANNVLQERRCQCVFRGCPSHAPVSTIHVVQTSPLPFPTGDCNVEMLYSDDDISISTTTDPSDLDFPLPHEIDTFWNYPLTALMMKPSLGSGKLDDIDIDDWSSSSAVEDNLLVPTSVDGGPPVATTTTTTTTRTMTRLTRKLAQWKNMIKVRIRSAPPREQPQLVSVVTSWANRVAADPLREAPTNHGVTRRSPNKV